MAEDEMVGWHHRLNGQQFEQTLGDSGRTEETGVLQAMASQRVGLNLLTEQQQPQKIITSLLEKGSLQLDFSVSTSLS